LPLQGTPDNPTWGNPVDLNQPPHILCITSKSVNSLNTKDDYLLWHATATAAAELQTNVLCLQENNLDWQPPFALHIQQIFCESPAQTITFATWNSTETTYYGYQPGGTITTALRSSDSHVTDKGTNPSGMSQ